MYYAHHNTELDWGGEGGSHPFLGLHTHRSRKGKRENVGGERQTEEIVQPSAKQRTVHRPVCLSVDILTAVAL